MYHAVASALERANVVVTSYSIVTSEYANYSPAKDESKSKGKGKKEDSESGDDSEDSVPKRAAPKKGKTMDALFRIKWWRIVLGAWIIRARRAMS